MLTVRLRSAQNSCSSSTIHQTICLVVFFYVILRFSTYYYKLITARTNCNLHNIIHQHFVKQNLLNNLHVVALLTRQRKFKYLKTLSLQVTPLITAVLSPDTKKTYLDKIEIKIKKYNFYLNNKVDIIFNCSHIIIMHR